MGKEKKEKRKSEAGEDGGDKGQEWEDLVSKVTPIANPLASRKLTKRLYKCIRKGKERIRAIMQQLVRFLWAISDVEGVKFTWHQDELRTGMIWGSDSGLDGTWTK